MGRTLPLSASHVQHSAKHTCLCPVLAIVQTIVTVDSFHYRYCCCREDTDEVIVGTMQNSILRFPLGQHTADKYG